MRRVCSTCKVVELTTKTNRCNVCNRNYYQANKGRMQELDKKYREAVEPYVYVVKNTVNNISYYGEATVAQRWSTHKNVYTVGNSPLYRAMIELGVENFYQEILCYTSSKEESLSIETFLINNNKNNYNYLKKEK